MAAEKLDRSVRHNDPETALRVAQTSHSNPGTIPTQAKPESIPPVIYICCCFYAALKALAYLPQLCVCFKLRNGHLFFAYRAGILARYRRLSSTIYKLNAILGFGGPL
jgi:hypothetical protein